MKLRKELVFLFFDMKEKLGRVFLSAVFLLVLQGVTEGIAISLLLPIMNLLIGGGTNQSGWFNNQFNLALQKIGLSNTLPTLLILFFFALALQYTMEISFAYFGSKSKADYLKHWRAILTERLMRCKWGFYINNNDAEVVSSIQQTSEKIGYVAWYFIQTFSLFFSMSIFLCLALFISWQITLLMSCIGVVLLPILIPFLNKVTNMGDKIVAADEKLSLWCSEVMSGAKYIKSVGGEDFAIQKFSEINEAHAQLSARSFFNGNVITSLYQGLTILMLVVSLVISIKVLDLSFLNVFMVLGLFSRLYPKYTNINNNLYLLKLNLSAFNYIKNLIQSMEDAQEEEAQVKENIIADDISFHNVTVKYKNKVAIKSLNMNIAAQKFTAIVGESGSGKTTALDAIMRLIDLDEGEICYGDISSQHISIANIRNIVGYVSQDTVLFNGSILENIVWGQKSYRIQDVEEALRLANAYEFVSQFEQGIYHQVGDRGVKLSGGQRQRLGIARALFQKKKILILDEPTSALDAIAESTILKALNGIKNKVTIIMVAHRLSTVKDADYIYVLGDGKLLEEGSWDELINKNTHFKQYYNAQTLVAAI